MQHEVLQLDIGGTPQDWLSHEDAASLIFAGDVCWTLGPKVATLRGGVSRMTGLQSSIEVPAILATRGQSRINLASQTPPLSRHNHKLFSRDCKMCAYCGDVFPRSNLTREHIKPRSRGGRDTWMNVVTACLGCNSRKGARTPEEANMPLLYLPYTPNWFEDLLLQCGGKTIIADQMDFLMAKIPAHSRLRLG